MDMNIEEMRAFLIEKGYAGEEVDGYDDAQVEAEYTGLNPDPPPEDVKPKPKLKSAERLKLEEWLVEEGKMEVVTVDGMTVRQLRDTKREIKATLAAEAKADANEEARGKALVDDKGESLSRGDVTKPDNFPIGQVILFTGRPNRYGSTNRIVRNPDTITNEDIDFTVRAKRHPDYPSALVKDYRMAAQLLFDVVEIDTGSSPMLLVKREYECVPKRDFSVYVKPGEEKDLVAVVKRMEDYLLNKTDVEKRARDLAAEISLKV